MKPFDQTGIKVLRVGDAIEQTAKAIFVRYHDKDFSFVDCTSFALIDHHRLDRAFAFDGTFANFVSKGLSSCYRLNSSKPISFAALFRSLSKSFLLQFKIANSFHCLTPEFVFI